LEAASIPAAVAEFCLLAQPKPIRAHDRSAGPVTNHLGCMKIQ
jgi:hypothetical protein